MWLFLDLVAVGTASRQQARSPASQQTRQAVRIRSRYLRGSVAAVMERAAAARSPASQQTRQAVNILLLRSQGFVLAGTEPGVADRSPARRSHLGQAVQQEAVVENERPLTIFTVAGSPDSSATSRISS